MSAPQEEHGILMQSQLEFEEQGCGACFPSRFRLFPSQKHDDVDRVNLLPERQRQDSWVVRQAKNKLRELSELVAGPKWKNFIRKIGAYFNYYNNNNKRKGFQYYDSFNYTLNFDNGIHDQDQDGANLGFSSRFAPPVLNDHKARSSASSML